MKSGFVITYGLLVCVGVTVSAKPPPPTILGLFLCFGAPRRLGGEQMCSLQPVTVLSSCRSVG